MKKWWVAPYLVFCRVSQTQSDLYSIHLDMQNSKQRQRTKTIACMDFRTEYKIVLLHEHKRHTAHDVSSTTRGGVPPWPGPTGGVPEVGNPPHQGIPLSGYPPARSDRGYLRWGTPQPDLMGGTPPTCGQTDGWMDRHVSKQPYLVLRTRSVNVCIMSHPIS